MRETHKRKNIEGKSELFFFLLLLLFFLPSSSHSLPKNTPRKKLTGHDGDDAGNGFDGLFWGVLGGKKEKERVSWGEFFFEFFFFSTKKDLSRSLSKKERPTTPSPIKRKLFFSPPAPEPWQ